MATEGEDGKPVVQEEVEGLDGTESIGWGEYPLDSVFVRTEQRTVGEVVRRIRANRYDLNPDFQREFVWPVEKQSRLIESCLMRLPLPVFYVAEAQDGRIIVVDGLQRLGTFRRFLDNDLKLSFPQSDAEKGNTNPLSGKRFRDLQLNLRERVEDCQLTLYVLDAKAPERAKLDIFERVNSGEPLTRQQMRNCLYNGPATLWLRSAAESESFLEATGRSLDRKKMRDREAINRFCAFRLLGWEAYPGSDMDGFLAETLERMNRFDKRQSEELRAAFERSMRINFGLWGRHAFRKSLIGDPAGYRSVLNIALFDVCSVLLADISDRSDVILAEMLRNRIRDLIQDGEFSYAITYSTNSKSQVLIRFGMMQYLVKQVLS
jgi:hypothetical protein